VLFIVLQEMCKEERERMCSCWNNNGWENIVHLRNWWVFHLVVAI